MVILTVMTGHLSSGLDLCKHLYRDAEGSIRHSRYWHRVMDAIQMPALRVNSAMFGAVIGTGFEMAAPTHIRVGDRSAFFQLPERHREIIVCGRGSVRIGCIQALIRYAI